LGDSIIKKPFVEQSRNELHCDFAQCPTAKSAKQQRRFIARKGISVNPTQKKENNIVYSSLYASSPLSASAKRIFSRLFHAISAISRAKK
jgi:hypothetical protein